MKCWLILSLIYSLSFAIITYVYYKHEKALKEMIKTLLKYPSEKESNS